MKTSLGPCRHFGIKLPQKRIPEMEKPSLGYLRVIRNFEKFRDIYGHFILLQRQKKIKMHH